MTIMDAKQQAIVGIASHFDTRARRAGWAVVVRMGERQILLHGPLDGARQPECDQHAMRQAISALRRLRVPLRAIEVTSEVKQALVHPHLCGAHARGWASAREWWKSVARDAGVRVTRKEDDTYSAARRMAEVAAISEAEKLKLTDQEVDTPWNRDHRARQAARRAENAERRAEREAENAELFARREREEPNEYAIASGRESPPDGYRPRRTSPSRKPLAVITPTTPNPSSIPGLDEAQTLEEILALLERT